MALTEICLDNTMPIQLSFLIIFINLFYTNAAADIVLDGSIGHSGPLQGPDFAIPAEIGQQHGGNLFHSFGQFDLQAGESATFSGPNTVHQIISRVTGGTRSHLNGLLRSTIPNADFYFLNSAGVIVGEQAQLDVQGSFYLSTADYLRLEDGGQFHASQPEKSLLTVAPPTAFGFFGPNVAPISLQNSEWRVPDDQTFSMVAGDISLTQSSVSAPDGQIQLASVASQAEVGVNLNNATVETFHQLGTIELIDSILGNKLKGFQAGENNWNGSQGIYMLAERFLVDNSTVNAQTWQNRQNHSNGIVIQSRETVTLKNHARLSTDSLTAADAGNITVHTNNLTMQQSAAISSNTQRDGAAGVITIKAKQLIMNDDARIGSETSYQGGPGGQIDISADVFNMQADTIISAATRQTDSPAGQIIITITDDFQMADDATINTGAYADGNGKGGNVTIQAKTLSLTDMAKIISTSFTGGQSGSLHIVADNLLLSKQSAVAATTFSQGNGGDVNVQIRHRFSMMDDAVIVSGTEGGGASGDILLLIQADNVAISNVANISSDSAMENALIKEVKKMLELAEQQGAEINDTVFVGGGKPGKLYLKTDKLFFYKRMKPFAKQWPFQQCQTPTTQQDWLTVEIPNVSAETVIDDIFFDIYD
jgi:filamentous hemagglutinin family protein